MSISPHGKNATQGWADRCSASTEREYVSTTNKQHQCRHCSEGKPLRLELATRV
jgi:hypothetical protein